MVWCTYCACSDVFFRSNLERVRRYEQLKKQSDSPSHAAVAWPACRSTSGADSDRIPMQIAHGMRWCA